MCSKAQKGSILGPFLGLPGPAPGGSPARPGPARPGPGKFPEISGTRISGPGQGGLPGGFPGLPGQVQDPSLVLSPRSISIR